MNNEPQTDQILEAFFAAEKDQKHDVPDAVMARVLGDAAALQPRGVSAQPAQPFLSRIFRGMNFEFSWPSYAALAACAVIGLSLGVSGSVDQIVNEETATGEVALELGLNEVFGDDIVMAGL